MEKLEREFLQEQFQESGKRETYLDCLRIMATFAVIVLHVAAQYWHEMEAGTYEWKVFNLYDGMVRWAVPVFLMISGSLFLSRPQKLERIFKKNILRIITAFLFWSAIYAITNVILGRSGWKNALREFVEGPTHFWFLFMIVGIYLLVPLLQKMMESDKLTGYFVLLSLIFTFVLPYSVTVISLYSSKLGEIAGGLLKSVGFHFTLGGVAYFVYGYYLRRIHLKKKSELAVYLLGIAGLAVTMSASGILPISAKDASVVFHDNMTLNVMLVSVALFVFAQNKLDFQSSSDKFREKLAKFADDSFGAYLVHALVITLLNHNPLFQLNTLQFKISMAQTEAFSLNPAISVPVIAIIVFVISFTISRVLHYIPGVKKYIV
ncbi:MAG: acyltransferase family protein [Muribaculaceae bacterium]|nr:acyltransferase family protein [Muribaculaceae bacterium]